jgi:hypothetical protein
VDIVVTGPPGISLDNRADLLRTLRRKMDDNGFALRAVRGGTFRRRIVAEGAEALDVLRRDEAESDSHEHWWFHDVTWVAGESKVVYWADPDGHDLTFYGWGEAAEQCLSAIAATLES